MAPTQLKWGLIGAKGWICVFLLLLQNLQQAHGMSGWGGCLDGQDVYAAVRENSPPVILTPELFSDYTVDGFSWSLGGKDADWFFLDGTNLWLNTSAEKVLDREAEGSVLMAELVCYEEDTLQSVYRIVVEILNENDNPPVFLDGTAQSIAISELTPVNAVVFKVHATDADNDKIIYTIDQTSPDAEYFKVVLPNSGEVTLSKPLDYETKTLLSVIIHASEMSTAEHYNTSTNITISVQDGDDQYPQFMPCTVLIEDVNTQVCINPTYTVNVTEGEQDIALNFSPGPIHAVDGDRGLGSSLSYVILTGNDDGQFLINRQTGELILTHGVADRLTTPALHLQVMAFQDNDPRKYSIAPVVVRILAQNQFHPEFEKTEYYGFVTAGNGPASLVHTFGSRALMLHVLDQDFNQSFNPMIQFSLSPTSNHTDVYKVTQEGLLIAMTGQFNPKERHIIQVTAIDQESGESTFTTVIVEVLSEGQTAPHSKVGEERLSGCVVGKAVFLCLLMMIVMGCLLYMGIWIKKKHKGHRDPLERGCVAQGKDPNVSLRWFQLVSHGSAMPQMEDLPFSVEDYGTSNPSFKYTDQDGPTKQEPSNTNDSVFSSDTPGTSAKHKAEKPTQSTSISTTFQAANEKATSQDTENLSIETLPCDSPLQVSGILSIPEMAPASTSSQNVEQAISLSPPLSPSNLLCRRIASAEIDKPFRRVGTPPKRPYSPLLSAKQASTPPPSPEQFPLKARLIHIDSSASDSPLKALEEMAVDLPSEIEPSTSLDNSDHSSVGLPQDGHSVGEEEEGGGEEEEVFLGEEESGSPDLQPDEEELLEIMARCHPVFITFKK